MYWSDTDHITVEENSIMVNIINGEAKKIYIIENILNLFIKM